MMPPADQAAEGAQVPSAHVAPERPRLCVDASRVDTDVPELVVGEAVEASDGRAPGDRVSKPKPELEQKGARSARAAQILVSHDPVLM